MDEVVAVTVVEPVTEIAVNAAELAIESVAVERDDGMTQQGSVVLEPDAERARFLFPAAIEPGPFGITTMRTVATPWLARVARLAMIWPPTIWELPWLVLLGQTALFLYFVHQVIAFTLVGEWLGWRFDRWPVFYAANAVFMLILLALGWVWRRLKRIVPDRPLPVIGRWARARARP